LYQGFGFYPKGGILYTPGLSFELLARWVQARVETLDELQEPHRIQVKDRSGLRVVAHLGGVAGDDNEIVEAARVVACKNKLFSAKKTIFCGLTR
jgi:hypothetical protein